MGIDRLSLLGELCWPETAARAREDEAVLVLPLGSTEQHGPHLPLSTDTDIAVELCRRLAGARRDVLVAPPLAYGASGEHAGFPGTLSIGREALELVLVELIRSATDTFKQILIVSTHGGNADAARRAEKRLWAESRDVRVWMPRADGDAHAGRSETSLQLAVDPDRVHMDLAVAGDTRPLAQLMPLLRATSIAAISPSGVLGDPTGATSDEGAEMFSRLATDLCAFVAAWRGGP